jgi:hypothetical protein
MRKIIILICLILVSWVSDFKPLIPVQDLPIIGVWQKQPGHTITFNLTAENKQQYDYKYDSEIHVWGLYELKEKRILFNDIGGNICDETGIYNYDLNNDTLKFSLVSDVCEGRINGMSGLWIRKNK